jgi:TonB family protein
MVEGFPSFLELVPRPVVIAAALVVLSGSEGKAENITGTVYDSDGMVVAGARVMLMYDYVKQSETKSGQNGEFVFADLKPGMYEVQVKQSRCQLFQQTVTLQGGTNEHIYAVVHPGRMGDSISVTAARPSIPRVPGRSISETPGAGGRVEIAKLKRPIRVPYPLEAVSQGLEGPVAIHARISREGSVTDPLVLASPGPELERAVLDAIGGLRYHPMKLNGHAIECQILLLVTFKLGNETKPPMNANRRPVNADHSAVHLPYGETK